MKLVKAIILFFLVAPVQAEEFQSRRDIPITISIRSIKDLRVKENQSLRIGQILATKPIEKIETPKFTSQKDQRAVEKQQRILKNFREIVKNENLSEILIQHEEAKLRDLQFKATENQLANKQPQIVQDTVYRSPVNGTIQRITPLSSSNGLLSVEMLVELN